MVSIFSVELWLIPPSEDGLLGRRTGVAMCSLGSWSWLSPWAFYTCWPRYDFVHPSIAGFICCSVSILMLPPLNLLYVPGKLASSPGATFKFQSFKVFQLWTGKKELLWNQMQISPTKSWGGGWSASPWKSLWGVCRQGFPTWGCERGGRSLKPWSENFGTLFCLQYPTLARENDASRLHQPQVYKKLDLETGRDFPGWITIPLSLPALLLNFYFGVRRPIFGSLRAGKRQGWMSHTHAQKSLKHPSEVFVPLFLQRSSVASSVALSNDRKIWTVDHMETSWSCNGVRYNPMHTRLKRFRLCSCTLCLVQDGCYANLHGF